MPLGDVEDALSRAGPRVIPGRERRVADADGVALHQPPVVRIGLALDQPPQPRQPRGDGLIRAASGFLHDLPQGAIPQRGPDVRPLRGEPSREAMAREVDAQLREPAVHRAVVAVLESLEVPAHARGAPGGIPGERGDAVPVVFVRIHEDQGVVGGAAAQGAGPRIEHAVDEPVVPCLPVLRVLVLARVALVVPDEEVPRHRVVLGREGVEGGHVVVLGETLAVGVDGIPADHVARVSARLEQHDGVARLGEAGGQRSAAGARAHHDVLAVRLPRGVSTTCANRPP